jgi:hypothetical protein
MMTVRRFQKWNVINVIYIQNDACFLPKRVNNWRYFKYLLTRQQMVFHLFFALTVSIRSCVLFPTLCGSINTKSMVRPKNFLWKKLVPWIFRNMARFFIFMVWLYHTFIVANHLTWGNVFIVLSFYIRAHKKVWFSTIILQVILHCIVSVILS